MWQSFHNGLIVSQMKRAEFDSHTDGPVETPAAGNLLWIAFLLGQDGPVCIQLISNACICGNVLDIKSDWDDNGEELGYDIIGIEDLTTGLVYTIPENVITSVSRIVS